jgi:hypothetical protein
MAQRRQTRQPPPCQTHTKKTLFCVERLPQAVSILYKTKLPMLLVRASWGISRLCLALCAMPRVTLVPPRARVAP